MIHSAERFVLRLGLLCAVGVGLGVVPTARAAESLWLGDYRHLHKSLAKSASAGDYDKLLEGCEKLLAINPYDAEALFFQTLAYAGLGDPQRSQAALGRTLQAGLPAERFVAGPRPWTKATEANVALADLRKRFRDRLIHGPMVGSVTDRSAKIWLRTARCANVQVVARLDQQLSAEISSPTVMTTPATDYTAELELEGLDAETRYFYDVRIDGRRDPRDPLPSFRTSPTPGRSTQLTFAFGGGAAYIPRNQRMWDVVASFQPELLLLLGDNVYIDDPRNRDYQRYIYYRRQSQPSYRRLCATTPVYSIWDDHDFGMDNCSGGPQVDMPRWKPRVWEVFRENWVNPAYGYGSVYPGCWYEFFFGDIHFLLLDGRYYRTPRPTATGEMPTMLGSVQRQWLLQRLEHSPARIKVIASPVPWVGGNDDKWNGYTEEREQVFAFVEAKKISGVLLLSADRHRSDLLVTRRPQGYDLYEFMSSRLTNHHRHAEIDERDGALFSYNEKCSFGLVTVDTQADEPCILYRIISIDGETVFKLRLKGSQLNL